MKSHTNKSKRSVIFALIIGFQVAAFSNAVRAHFIWAYREEGKIKVVFGEGLEPDEAIYLTGLNSMKVFTGGEQPTELSLTQKSDGDQGWFEITTAEPAMRLNCPYGVFERGDQSMWLDYSARYIHLPAAKNLKHDANLTLDVVPTFRNGSLELTATFQGELAANVELTITSQDGTEVVTQTNDQGVVTVATTARYMIVAKKVVDEVGEFEGKKFDEKRYYCTLVLDVGEADQAVDVVEVDATKASSTLPETSRFYLEPMSLELPEFPRAMTSFGAVAMNGQIYVVGGKEGRAHSYAKSYQNRSVFRLNPKSEQNCEWETVGECLGLQGLALVGHREKIYRIGGLEAKNREGEDHDLHSVPDFVCFNPVDGSWMQLPNLPVGRSSIDACVVGDTIYVVGGWTMTGQENSTWCNDMLIFDLNHQSGNWESIPVPFHTRALAVREHAGKLLAMGGIQETGGPTAAVHIFDPNTNRWSGGPELPVTGPMKAFGCSAVNLGDQLLVSTYDGSVLVLGDDAASWKRVGELETGRFFHQMLPLSETTFAIVGGANMETGGRQEIEVYELVGRDASSLSAHR